MQYVRMSPDRESPEPTPGDSGVFGNLPSSRPGVRSPRREGDKRGTAKSAKAKAAGKPPPSRSSPSSPRPHPREQPALPREPSATAPDPSPYVAPQQEPTSSRAGIEEVAWAGVTVAAEAATLGVRLFSRALEAVRERR